MCWWLPVSICIPDISVKLQSMGQMYLATPPQTRALCSLPKASEWQLPSPAYALGWLAESISVHHTHSFGAVSLKWIQIKRHVLSSTVWAKRPSSLHSWLVILSVFALLFLYICLIQKHNQPKHPWNTLGLCATSSPNLTVSMPLPPSAELLCGILSPSPHVCIDAKRRLWKIAK